MTVRFMKLSMYRMTRTAGMKLLSCKNYPAVALFMYKVNAIKPVHLTGLNNLTSHTLCLLLTLDYKYILNNIF